MKDFFGLIAFVLRDALAAIPRETGPRKPEPSKSAAINRWTGKPHEHARAKARRLRQIGRDV